MVDSPNNEAVFNRLPQDAQAGYLKLRTAAERAAAKNPGMQTGIYTRLLDGYLKNEVAYQATMNDLKQPNAAGIRPDRQDIRIAGNAVRNRYITDFSLTVAPEDKQAWQSLMQEIQPKSALTSAVKQFYDSDKNGFQFDGLIGAVIGGAATALLVGGTGTWIGVGAIAIGTLIGAWSGNKSWDFISSRMGNNKTPSTPSSAVASAKGPNQNVSMAAEASASPALHPEVASAAQKAASGVPLKGTNVSASPEGGFAPAAGGVASADSTTITPTV